MLKNILIQYKLASYIKLKVISLTVIKLYFKDNEFVEESKMQLTGTEQAVLEINTETKHAQLEFKGDVTFIGKKVAERQSLSICKSGFLLQSGERIGNGCNLTISS